MPALRAPRISELRLSPTSSARSRLKSGMRPTLRAKNSALGFTAPSSSETKMRSKKGAIPALAIRPACTFGVPLETI